MTIIIITNVENRLLAGDQLLARLMAQNFVRAEHPFGRVPLLKCILGLYNLLD
jgi:hypothetical protein